MPKVIPSGQFIYVPGPPVVLDDAFFSQLEQLTKLQFSAEHRREIEQALKAYVDAYHLHAEASRPKAVKPVLEQIRKLSIKLADLIESRSTESPVNAAVLLMGQADDEADDNWRTVGDASIRATLVAAYQQHEGEPPPIDSQPRAERRSLDWRAIADTLRRIERAADCSLTGLQRDAGGPAGDPFLHGLIRTLYRAYEAAGGDPKSRGCYLHHRSGCYRGPFFQMMHECLTQAPGHLPDGTGLGKAILRALK